MSDDRVGVANPRNFMEQVNRSRERPIAGFGTGSDRVKRQKCRRSQGLMVVDPADGIVTSPVLRLPPNLSHGDVAAHQSFFESYKATLFEHDTAVAPTAHFFVLRVKVR